MQRDLTKVDFAQRKTDFSLEFERARTAFVLELRELVKPKGWLNRLFYRLAREPFLWSAYGRK